MAICKPLEYFWLDRLVVSNCLSCCELVTEFSDPRHFEFTNQVETVPPDRDWSKHCLANRDNLEISDQSPGVPHRLVDFLDRWVCADSIDVMVQ
jgi:hypothetical protein